ncbi:voltage-dependent calcium channel gamma-7 subunit [Procambarus clarkii]|uniref:voltage-dependent calcium channel gamma-7 subunit n=1 Tax=Procambarus clarkii TaxID=6728 RepID=UPI001E671277|nr:voltage-dependent calcium channel gamma-7 subunit-like [Procambarus clarkii]
MVNRQAAHAVLVEKRVLMAVTVFLAIGLLLWIIAVSTDYWGIVDGGKGIYVPATKRYFLQSHSGIWKSCRMAYENKTKEIVVDPCIYHKLFPKVIPLHKTFLDYQRTVASFSIISLLVMIMGFVFSVYTFHHTRYMYKRLAACSHVISAGCVLIVLEVSVSLYHFEEANLPNRQPPGSTWSYGFSFMLAWVSFIAEAAAAIAFGICSRKRKKDKAPDDRYAIEEEPTIIGR